MVDIFAKLANFYYYNLSGREYCNTGIAPCFVGFFEMHGIQMLGWILSLLLIRYFLFKNNIKRKWFVLIMGVIVCYLLSILIGLNIDYEILNKFLFTNAFLYLISFGGQYLIFSKWLR